MNDEEEEEEDFTHSYKFTSFKLCLPSPVLSRLFVS